MEYPQRGKLNTEFYRPAKIIRQPGAGDLLPTPQTSVTVNGAWTANAVRVGVPLPNDDGTETVTFRDTVPYGGAGRFIRLQVTIAP